jgi:hypothetical protein
VFGENMGRIRDALISAYHFTPAQIVRRSARLLQAYELDFWQAASEPPGSPLRVVFHPGG